MIDPCARLSRDGLAVFLFHGVIESQTSRVRNYTGKHMPREAFARVVRELRQRGAPLSMDQVLEIAESGRPFPPFAYAVTFDDGFANNHSLAAPILADENTPAAFYVATGFIENNAMSWIDRVEHCLERVEQGALRLPWANKAQAFRSPEDKIRLLTDIRREVKKDPAIDLDGFAEDISRQCGLEPVLQDHGPLDQKMTWAQVRDLARDPLFIVGGHSHSHAVLGFLGPEAMDREISTSLRLLETRAGVGPRHYSYPEGLAHCYSEAVIAALKGYGVRCCPTAEDGVNPPGQDPFHLKRIMVS
ncbi:MAG: polysaccharide deacetylase family protein [Desulfovibrionaceae bacterium]|nr:polysaccharide deacetylase family protein [Desulfovibrionaceae bacterium]